MEHIRGLVEEMPHKDTVWATVWRVVRKIFLYSFLVLFMPGGIPLTVFLVAKKFCERKKASGIASVDGSCDEGGADIKSGL